MSCYIDGSTEKLSQIEFSLIFKQNIIIKEKFNHPLTLNFHTKIIVETKSSSLLTGSR